MTTLLAEGLKQTSMQLLHDSWFDTVTLVVGDDQQPVIAQLGYAAGINAAVLAAGPSDAPARTS